MYGRVNENLVQEIIERTCMSSDDVYSDLGCGIGQVPLLIFTVWLHASASQHSYVSSSRPVCKHRPLRGAAVSGMRLFRIAAERLVCSWPPSIECSKRCDVA